MRLIQFNDNILQKMYYRHIKQFNYVSGCMNFVSPKKGVWTFLILYPFQRQDMRLIPFIDKILQKMYSRHIKQFNYTSLVVWTKKGNLQLLMLKPCEPKTKMGLKMTFRCWNIRLISFNVLSPTFIELLF